MFKREVHFLFKREINFLFKREVKFSFKREVKFSFKREVKFSFERKVKFSFKREVQFLFSDPFILSPFSRSFAVKSQRKLGHFFLWKRELFSPSQKGEFRIFYSSKVLIYDKKFEGFLSKYERLGKIITKCALHGEDKMNVVCFPILFRYK